MRTLLFVNIVSLIMLSACGEQANVKVVHTVIHPAKIFTVKNPNNRDYRNFPAEVEANTKSKLAFRVNGQIVDFPVRAGNEVKQDQLLVKLDPKDFQLRVDDRTARYQLAKSQFERAKVMLVRKLAPQSQFDQAKANLSVALSSLNSAKTELKYTHLTAPFSGSIANVMVKNHETIQAKQTILTLISRDMIDISIQIPESIISRVKKDTHYQPTVIFDSHPKQEFLVSVKEWDTQANSSTLSYRVVFSLPAPKTFNVLPGMSANIRIDLAKVTNEQKNKFLLPVSAVFSPEDKSLTTNPSYIWLVNSKTMKVNRKKVIVGNITSQGIEILNGIVAGDQVVAAGVHYLSEGMQIKSWDREQGL
ncbi:MAG: efflux transporter periplasmic adaptor subunit [Gammaproteobacteria bacterium]|nr:MAG: efflux transporter periplasmic adaptor subunit [Gammaproteobacteria bacterium]